MHEIRRKTILAIDDNLTTLTTIRTILEGGFEVCLAKSAEIAQTILETTEVDMILLDLEMPGISGIEFLKVIKDTPALYSIPVVVVSSHGTANVIVEAKKLGAKDFLVKPFAPKILLDRVHSVLDVGPQKITREILLRKLKFLEDACKQGKTWRVEEMIVDLEPMRYSFTVDKEVAEICKCAAQLDYNLALQKITILSGSPDLIAAK